jgi:formate-dependent nitrite reductase cytochrome c552 subunit
MQRVGQGHTNKFNPKRKKGHFYLRRDANAVVAASANAAVANGILTMAFVTSMASWSLRVIQGQ